MVNINSCLACEKKFCTDVNKENFVLPAINIDVDKVKIIIISEVPPQDSSDYFYAMGNPFYMQTTVQAFQDAGIQVQNITDILDLGVYITTAVKCSKNQYAINAKTIKECSYLLEKELSYFNNVRAYLLMGDVAIKAMNYIGTRLVGKKLIPSGSTYKIRKEAYFLNGKRIFPSYLQTGGNYLIEKSKRIMIAEDIQRAFEFANSPIPADF